VHDNRLPQRVNTYLVETLAIDCLSRAQNACTEAPLANDVNDLLTACGWFPAGNPEQIRAARLVAGDIKQFWREASEENQNAIKKKASGVEPDLAGPLPTYVASKLQSTWMNWCHFELHPCWRLAPNQMGRLNREVEKAALTLWLMEKVKLLPQSRHDRPDSKIPIDPSGGTGVSLNVPREEASPEPLVLVSAYLDMLWIWMTNLAYVGIHGRAPDGARHAAGHADFDKPYVRWDTALHYHQFAKEKATTVMPDGRVPSLAQVKLADEKTRLHWMRLTGPDALVRKTLNDAIEASMRECHHLWSWTAFSADAGAHNGKRKAAGLDDGANLPPNAAAAKTGRYCKGQQVCKKCNDGRAPCGQSGGMAKPCPDRKKHCCDVLIADNECCGGNHPRASCPHAAASHQFRNDKK
ncbi:MAG: hypothetical protein VYB61_05220, partial [Verrucomicrobiota bacterium]|nr:hypothetical protein [Verrucomicrobiota bacterium]